MIYEGKEYLPNHRGRYYCPWECHNPDWPVPHWQTEKGFIKHLTGCPNNPIHSAQWSPVSTEEPSVFGMCPDCDKPIMKYDPIWRLRDKIVCSVCGGKYMEVGVGFNDCAGFELPGLSLEGF